MVKILTIVLHAKKLMLVEFRDLPLGSNKRVQMATTVLLELNHHINFHALMELGQIIRLA